MNRIELDVGKTFVNTMGMECSKFGNETHFLTFAAIIATGNGN